MTSSTLDGSSTPFVIPPGTIEQANDGDALFLLGTIENHGTIFTNAVGTPSAANLVSIVLAGPAVTLDGGGTLLLTGAFDTQIYGSSATVASLVNVDNTITGAGDIGEDGPFTLDASTTLYPISFTNEVHGVINGNGTVAGSGMGPPPGMFIGTGTAPLVNNGLIEATDIDGLFFDSATIDQSAGSGTILASGAGVTIASFWFDQNGGVDIIGGTLEVSDGGQIELGGATLDGSVTPLTVGAGLDLAPQSLAEILGTIDNFGTLDMTGADFGIGNIFLGGATVTLAGNGQILSPTFTGAGGNPVTLVNVANTISGTGEIGMATITDSAFGTLGGSAPVAITNQANGIIDATGTDANPGGGGFTVGDSLYIFGGGSVLLNDGLLEATGIGGLNIASATLDQSGGGTLLASGAGVPVYLQNVDIIGGHVDASGGGTIEFDGGNNTLDSGAAPLVIGAGGVLEVTSFINDATLTLTAATIDNLGTLVDTTTLVLGSPTVTLTGGGLLQLSGKVNTAGPTTLINTNNLVTGGVISGTALDITDAAAGVFNGSEFNTGGTLTNAGLLQDVNVSSTTVENIGTGNLLATSSVALSSADIIGGTLAATGGAEYFITGGVTLDGRSAPVTIEAGTTLQDFFDELSPPFTFEISGGLAMIGTIDFAGTIVGATPGGLGGPVAIPNAGLLVGTGDLEGSVTNTGTLLAQGGTMTVTGDVVGSGSIAIAPGSAFVVGGTSNETVDFRNAQNGRLVLNTPTAFTGTLANMTFGDILDLGTDDIQSATVVGGNTLAVTLTDTSTIDFTLASLQAGTSFKPLSTTELQVACFAEGTRIRTLNGERRVETLRADDAVTTAGGSVKNIVWVGHRGIDCARHPRPHDILPIRILSNAFGPNTPHADLRLSPDHAVLVDGVLIPVRYLVNDATIVREHVETITYWHVELETHDALVAENLPCESYLDTGNRGAFVAPDGDARRGRGTEIDRGAQRGDPEAGRPVRIKRERNPNPRLRQRQCRGQQHAAPDACRQPLRRRRRPDHQREHQQHADDLRALRRRQRDDGEEEYRIAAQRDAPRLRQFRLQAGEQQRARYHREGGEAGDPEHEKCPDRAGIDRQHVAEQQRGRLRGGCGVEMQEQQAEAERQRQHHADRDVPLRQPLAHQAHGDAGRDGHQHQAPEWRNADQERAGRAGEADMRQRVAGKRLAAQHQEIADRAGQDGDHGRGRERVAHEIVVKHGHGHARDDDRHAPCRVRPT